MLKKDTNINRTGCVADCSTESTYLDNQVCVTNCN